MQKSKSLSAGHAQKRIRQPVEGLFCNYTHRTCMHNRIDGYEYCLRHILEDKNAPYKQCGFISSKNGKRCPNAAPKVDRKDGYCAEHSRRATLLRQKSARKPQPKETAEGLLEELDHFKATDSYLTESRRNKGHSDSLASKVLEYASSSDSDAEPPLVDQAWRGDVESDAESIDSDQEDPLKHAGVYTAEEVALIMRDKLIRLQSLYIDQFKRLQHVMREKRRKFLQTHKQEKEALGSLLVYKDKPETRDKYVKLKALKRYHRRHGKEALLHRQSKQRRIAVSEGQNYRPPSYARCMHVEDSVKCTTRALPLTKYCSQHVLQDPFQVLYRTCQFGNGKCGRSVLSIQEEAFCKQHTQINPLVTRIPIKTEDTEEDMDVTRPGQLIHNDILLPHLDSLGMRDSLAQHLLSRNPQLPDSIFSGSESDLMDNPLTPSKMDTTGLLSNDCDQPRPSQQSTIDDINSLSNASSSSLPQTSDERKEKKMAYGPLLLQHLQGKVDLTNIHRRRVPPAPSTSSPSASDSSATSTASAPSDSRLDKTSDDSEIEKISAS